MTACELCTIGGGWNRTGGCRSPVQESRSFEALSQGEPGSRERNAREVVVDNEFWFLGVLSYSSFGTHSVLYPGLPPTGLSIIYNIYYDSI